MKYSKLFVLAGAPVAIVAGLVVTFTPLLAGDTRQAVVSKRAVLENIAARVYAPAYSDLADKSADLAAAADELAANPGASSLARAQHAWKRVLLAWRRTQSFAHGPIESLGVYPRMQFWPARRQSVERVLLSQRPLDDTYIQELGANSVGLSALELMLFDPRQSEPGRVAAFKGDEGARRRRYVQALARELAKQTGLVARAWRGPAGYAGTFGAGGQPQLNLLINDMLEAIETRAENRLRVVIERHTEKEFRSEVLEGGPSGTSQQGVLTMLIGAKDAFSGGRGVGIDDYLGQLKSPAGRRMDAQFQRAIDAVQAIGPLDQAIVSRQQAVKQAHEECRALEIMLKVEVASALGVTLTFKAIDGD